MIKKFLLQTVSHFHKEFKIDFQNSKWNCLNRKWNHFSQCRTSDQNTSFIRCFTFFPWSLKWNFKTGNRIIQTGNGIISPTFRPLIAKLFFYTVFLILTKEFKIDFQNRNWNYQNRKWNYFFHFQASDQKTTFTKCF